VEQAPTETVNTVTALQTCSVTKYQNHNFHFVHFLANSHSVGFSDILLILVSGVNHQQHVQHIWFISHTVNTPTFSYFILKGATYHVETLQFIYAKTKIQDQSQIYRKCYNQYYDKSHCYFIMCLPLCCVLFIVSYTFLMCEKDVLWPNYSCPSAPLLGTADA
jgi:hypothetical protein